MQRAATHQHRKPRKRARHGRHGRGLKLNMQDLQDALEFVRHAAAGSDSKDKDSHNLSLFLGEEDEHFEVVERNGRMVYRCLTSDDLRLRAYYRSKEWFDFVMATYPELYGYDSLGEGTGWPDGEIPVWNC